ncbi:MAG: GIY-YIG nuclease family protein [Methylocystaceae bacterium]
MSRNWYVYILGCADGTYYTGITIDVVRRIAEHNSARGGSHYTRPRRPVKLLVAWQVDEQGPAL